MARGNVSERRPRAPFRPSSFQVHAVKEGRTKTRDGRSVPCFDVTIRADSHRFLKRISGRGITKAAVTANYVNRLQQDYLRGWEFDPDSKMFLDPDRPRDAPTERRPTVFTEALTYMGRRWGELEPRSRQSLERSLRRACIHLLRSDERGTAPEPPAEAVTWLRKVAFSPPVDPKSFPTQLTDEWRADHPEAAWWLEHSRAFTDVTTQDLVDMLDRYLYNQHTDGDPKRVLPSTERRFVAELRPFWREVVDRLELEKNPWDREVLRNRGRAERQRRRIGRIRPVDRDLVLSYDQVRDLARCCADYGRWGDRVIAYTLLMGWSGLRPGEAAAARISNLQLSTADGVHGWLTIDRSRRREVNARWFEAGEDPDEGPLKSRAAGDARRVPLTPELVAVLRDHIGRFAHKGNDLLFTYDNGGMWDPAKHWIEVWQPGRAALFPASDTSARGQKLANLRRHDLRHAACSAWLNAGVSPKVAQQWSGHSQLSVFLDVYQGVIEGAEDEGVRKWQTYIEPRTPN